MWEIVGGVVRYCDLVAKKKKSQNFFPGVLVIRKNFARENYTVIYTAKLK